MDSLEVALRVAAKENAKLNDENVRLRARLELSADHNFDGIACRDVTIKMQDDEIKKLRADNTALTERLAQEREIGRQEGRAEADVDGFTHRCISCGVQYSPEPFASEDCPKCGCDGTEKRALGDPQ